MEQSSKYLLIVLLVAAFNLRQTETSPTADHNRSEESEMSMQNDETEDKEIRFVPDVSECDGESFCSHIPNYPDSAHLQDLIQSKYSDLESQFDKSSNLELLFDEDVTGAENITQPMNDDESLCLSRTRIIYPQAAKDKDYSWLTIVNVPEYRQGIRIEECIRHGSSCGESQGMSLPNRFGTYCKQSFIYRTLVSYQGSDTLVQHDFRLPSCCQCVVRDLS